MFDFICDCVDERRSRRCDLTTFLARCSQRRSGARASVARARPSLRRATASLKNERKERSRDREISEISRNIVYTFIVVLHGKIFTNINSDHSSSRAAGKMTILQDYMGD